MMYFLKIYIQLQSLTPSQYQGQFIAPALIPKEKTKMKKSPLFSIYFDKTEDNTYIIIFKKFLSDSQIDMEGISKEASNPKRNFQVKNPDVAEIRNGIYHNPQGEMILSKSFSSTVQYPWGLGLHDQSACQCFFLTYIVTQMLS